MWKAIFRWIFKHPEVVKGVLDIVSENRKEGQDKK
jgi:hypothetical protein